MAAFSVLRVSGGIIFSADDDSSAHFMCGNVPVSTLVLTSAPVSSARPLSVFQAPTTLSLSELRCPLCWTLEPPLLQPQFSGCSCGTGSA